MSNEPYIRARGRNSSYVEKQEMKIYALPRYIVTTDPNGHLHRINPTFRVTGQCYACDVQS